MRSPALRGTVSNPDRRSVAGQDIGILHIDSNYPLVPGNAQNATTFPFPVRYECVAGLAIPELLSGAETGEARIIAAAQKLEKAGVRAIVGACGSFANYQTAVANAVSVPVFTSVMLLVPLLLNALGPERRLAIVFASAHAYTDRVRRECRIPDDDRIVVAEARDLPAFAPILANESELDDAALETQVRDLVAKLVADEPRIACVVLQCSDLPPYAAAIQAATGVPVVDVVTLVGWAHAMSVRVPYG